jgi:putative two-component system response regulator
VAKKHILIVDDDPLNRELLEAILEGLGYACESASGGVEALAALKLNIDLILLDVNMADMDGFTVARTVRENEAFADLPIIMVTALSSKEDRLHAVEAGANDFVAKPIDRTELRVRIASQLRIKEGQDAIKQNQLLLEERVQERTHALQEALERVMQAEQLAQEAKLDTVRRLAIAAEYRDDNTAAHIQRVGHYCALLGRLCHLPEREVEMLYHASLLHDVGKIGVPDSILLKPGRLTEEEWHTMREHTLIGEKILSNSPSDILQIGEQIATTHHERWDGTGYPRGLCGEEIPLYGRICAVADVFDALTSARPYKKRFSNAQALEMMQLGRGTHFDPALLDLFIANFGLFVEIQLRYSEALQEV